MMAPLKTMKGMDHSDKSSNPPLVTVVTPSFNQGRFIRHTIESVFSQAYPNVEYWVIDGGSTDETQAVLKSYGSRLNWISERDHGQADAVNKGFQKANGQIFGWLNSDDTYLPGAITKVVKYFEEHPNISMLYGEAYNVDADGNIVERSYTEPFDLQRLAEVCFICQPTVFMRADVFNTVGPLDTRLHYCLDYDYWIRVAKQVQIGYIKEFLATSRLHMEAKTFSKRVQLHEEILETVRRHYGQVPLRQLAAYAYVSLFEKYIPNIQGIYVDGWASQSVRIFPHDPKHSYRFLKVEGEGPGHPVTVTASMGGERINENTIDGGRFSWKWPLPEIDRDSAAVSSEIVISTNQAFSHRSADDVGTGTLSHRLTQPSSYRISNLALIDHLGKEQILYSKPKALKLLLMIPFAVLLKSWKVNRGIPLNQGIRDGRKIWKHLMQSLLRAE